MAARAGITAGRVVKWLAIALITLALILGAVLLGINTDAGRGFVGRQIAGYSTQSGLRFRVGRIDGSIYGRMTLRDVSVRDTRGVFVTAPVMTLDWRPFAYARGKVDVRELSAATVRVLRRPVLAPTDPNAPWLPDLDIAVARLSVDQLVLEPPVTGSRHIVRVAGSADIADGRARIDADALARTGAGLAGGDRLVLRLDAMPDRDRLIIDARVTAPAGGLVDSYAKLGKPLALQIGGRGSWTRWSGRAQAALGGQPLANLAVAADGGSFRVTGPVRPGLILPGVTAALTSPALALDLTARLDQRRVALSGTGRSDALAVETRGLIDLGTSRFGGLMIDARILRPGALAGNVRARDLRLGLRLDGAFAQPLVGYRATAQALAINGTVFEGFVAQGRARVDAGRIIVPVAATARRVVGLNAAVGGLLTNLRVDGDLAIAGGRILSDNLRLRSDRIDATAVIVADLNKGLYTGAIKGRLTNYLIAGLGLVDLTTDARLVSGQGGFGIKGRVRIDTRSFERGSVRDFLGGNAVATADVSYGADGVARFGNLRVVAPALRVTSGGGVYGQDGRFAVQANGVSRQYGPFAATVTGTAANPVIRIRAARPMVGVQLSNVEAEIVGTPAGYRIRARGGSDYGPFKADLILRSGSGPLTVDIAAARFAGVDFRGTVAQTAAGPYAGTLRANGSGFDGTIRLAAAGRYQRADIDARAANARVPYDPPITIGSGIIRATVIAYPNAPAITADAQLANVRKGSLLVTGARTRIRYQGGRGSAALVASGTSGVPFTLAAQAALAPDRIRANARGTLSGLPFRLAQPADILKVRGGYALQPATILLPRGRVELAGQFGAATRLQARLQNVDVGLIQAFKPGLGFGGRATGTVDYAQAGNGIPDVRARIDIARFTRTGATSVSAPVDVALLTTLAPGGGEARALIRGGGATVGRLSARLSPAGAGAWTTRLAAGALSGGIRYNGPAEILWSLTGITGQEVRGPVGIGADFSGRLEQPNLVGVVRSNALVYENQLYGTRVNAIAVNGRFNRSQLEIVSLTGRVGRGTVTARGTVGLDLANGFPIDLATTFTNAQLARSDALGATVTGTVNITNSRSAGALVKGDLTLPEARYQIIRQGAAEVAELIGVRRRGGPPPGSVVAEASAVPSIWKLDLRVRSANRLYVSGMGLESEWRSDLRVGGTSGDPRVTGGLDLIRGTYSFSGRRFDVTRGVIRFGGGAVTNPQIDITASTSVEGVTAQIVISGRAQSPQIAFTSTPVLPQDEVLARLLFGGSVTSLSPVQAIQLAAALNSLRGTGGGGLNPLGKLRSAAGIDRLRVLGADKSASRGTALAAGKYITKDIYLEIITDARGFTATQLEIALTRALSVLSQTSSFGGSNASLRYSKDF